MEELKIEGQEVGRITGFFKLPGAAIVEITNGSLKVGDKIRIKGHTTNLELAIESMQIEHTIVQEAAVGQTVGIKVPQKVRQHDIVYKI